jgi:plastocyanin
VAIGAESRLRASVRTPHDSVASPIITPDPSSIFVRVRRAAICTALLLACLLAPAVADAKQQTFTMRYGPVELGGYQTAYPEAWVRTPKRTGYITKMSARVVDGHGRRMPLGHVMLHHVVFINSGHPGGLRKNSSCPGRPGEPFYGTGEENQKLLLPPGYGYRVHRRDRWRMIAMLMSHHLEQTKARIEYRITIETSKKLTPVRPLWLRANGCDPTSSYTVPGGGAPGSSDVRSADWPMPISGRIVAAGAHLHGSAKRLTITQPRCANRTLIDHRPRWGAYNDAVYKVRPLLHEPGPIAVGYFLSRRGIPIRRGEPLNVTGVYDAQLAHPAVMSITHIYVARDDRASSTCDPLPPDRRIFWSRKLGRNGVAPMQLPLTGLDDRGHARQIARAAGPGVVAGAAATVNLERSLFSPPNLSIALGGEVTWRSLDQERHVVILANGPRAVDSPLMRQGATHRQRFDVAGTYNLFCYLHPVTMHQTLVVRPE